MNKRIKRHHTVSRFYLRGFADEADRVRRIEIPGKTSVTLSIDNASVVKDFYTIILPDGSPSDAFERAFSSVESGAASALRSILSGQWPLVGKEREQ
ncbi:MAG: DUF4238 domain-containing protein, partial [bacterium]|nr:DUF4238 domain-containing protein [bacterium]